MVTTNALRIGGDALPSKGYPPLSVFTIPVISGLTGCFVFSSGPTLALTNWAGGADATLYGSMIDGTGYCTVNDVMDSKIAETPATTMIALVRKIAGAGNTGIMGTFNGGANEGISMFSYDAVTVLNATIQKSGGPDVSLSVNIPLTDWALVSLVQPATGAGKLRNHTLGQLAVSSNTAATAVTGVETVYVGGLVTTTFRAPIDMSLALVFNRALSDIEIESMATWARAHAATFGITA